MTRKQTLLIALALVLVVAVGTGFGAQKKQAPTLKFDHYLHVSENGMMCTDCHEAVESLGAGKMAYPDHDVCSMCHDVEDFDNCGTCHVNPDEPMPAPRVQGKYEGFAHKVHADEQKLDCTKCHGVVKSAGAQMQIPGMKDCQTCHLQANGPLECADCHLGAEPKPADHKMATWKHDHGLEATFTTSDCAMCHTQQSCDECHQGELLDGRPHPAGWEFNHFTEASYGEDCLVCHETRTFCTDCHKVMTPLPHKLGAEWANYPNGGEHVDEARAFGETCISCHDLGGNDPTCARCHE